MHNQQIDKKLDETLGSLSLEITPERDLWVGIEHAIEMHEDGRTFYTKKFLMAAAVCFIIFGGSWVFYPQLNSPMESLMDDEPEVNMAVFIEEMDTRFAFQKAHMLMIYEDQEPLVMGWKNQLKELELAREGVRAALVETPDNVYMMQILQHIQERQLELIESVHSQVALSI